uniref:Ion channel protein n=1 Tax=Tetranychus cinnabarinus TaxID=93129 RepID=A0A4Y5UXR5_TETCI|nr:ion channel protein [Tetranychus cinnabarinus]
MDLEVNTSEARVSTSTVTCKAPDQAEYMSVPEATLESSQPLDLESTGNLLTLSTGSTFLSLWPWLRYVDEEADGSSSYGDQVDPSLVSTVSPLVLTESALIQGTQPGPIESPHFIDSRDKSGKQFPSSAMEPACTLTKSNVIAIEPCIKRPLGRLRSGSSGAPRFSNSATGERVKGGLADRRASCVNRVDFPPSFYLHRTRRLSRKQLSSEREGSSSSSVSAAPITNPDLPYPDYTELSFRCLSQYSPVRRVCLAMISNPWFERISIMAILLNCITLGMYQPCVDEVCHRSQCKALQVFDDMIFLFFAAEMFIKMTAMGIRGSKGAYLSETWNRLDFFIVIAGGLEYINLVGNINLSAIRTVRVLRPLRAINRIPSMRILVMLLLDTLPMLGNVLLLCFFVFFIFGIIGVQLWAGLLRQRCFLELPENITLPDPIKSHYQVMADTEKDYICSLDKDHGMHRCDNLPLAKIGKQECLGEAVPFSDNKPNETWCVNWNRYYTKCKHGDKNPFQGAMSFDNVGMAWTAIFLVISLEGWTEIMYYVQDAHSFWDWLYFVLLIVIGSFFMINLCLVVIATQFSETKKRELERMKQERASSLASGSESEPTNCYDAIIKYLAHLGRRAKRKMWRYYREYRRRKRRLGKHGTTQRLEPLCSRLTPSGVTRSSDNGNRSAFVVIASHSDTECFGSKDSRSCNNNNNNCSNSANNNSNNNNNSNLIHHSHRNHSHGNHHGKHCHHHYHHHHHHHHYHHNAKHHRNHRQSCKHRHRHSGCSDHPSCSNLDEGTLETDKLISDKERNSTFKSVEGKNSLTVNDQHQQSCSIKSSTDSNANKPKKIKHSTNSDTKCSSSSSAVNGNTGKDDTQESKSLSDNRCLTSPESKRRLNSHYSSITMITPNVNECDEMVDESISSRPVQVNLMQQLPNKFSKSDHLRFQIPDHQKIENFNGKSDNLVNNRHSHRSQSKSPTLASTPAYPSTQHLPLSSKLIAYQRSTSRHCSAPTLTLFRSQGNNLGVPLSSSKCFESTSESVDRRPSKGQANIDSSLLPSQAQHYQPHNSHQGQEVDVSDASLFVCMSGLDGSPGCGANAAIGPSGSPSNCKERDGSRCSWSGGTDDEADDDVATDDEENSLDSLDDDQVCECCIESRLLICLRFVRRYLRLLVNHRYFQRFIFLAILFNTLSMGIEYHNQPDELTQALEMSNLIFTFLFGIEMALKILAEGCFHYISDGFNVFDGIVVIVSIMELIEDSGSGLSVLRTFRLLRILKLVRFMPALKRQLVIMLRTLDNVAVFFALLVLFIFIFSCLGMHLFGGKFCSKLDGSPCSCRDILNKNLTCICDRKRFDNFLWALVTVFQILTQEDWNVVLFNGMERTTHWAALYFVVLMTFGNYVLFNLLVAILVEGFSQEKDEDKKDSLDGEDEDNEQVKDEKLIYFYNSGDNLEKELHLLTNPPGITSRFRNKVDASTEQPFQETNAQSDFSSYYPPRIIHTAATPQGSPGPQELSYGHKHLNLSSLALNSQPQFNVEKSQSKFEDHTSSSSIGRKLSTLTSLMPNLIPGTPFRLSPYSTIRRPSISKVDYPDRCYGSLVSPPIVVERSSQPSTGNEQESPGIVTSSNSSNFPGTSFIFPPEPHDCNSLLTGQQSTLFSERLSEPSTLLTSTTVCPRKSSPQVNLIVQTQGIIEETIESLTSPSSSQNDFPPVNSLNATPEKIDETLKMDQNENSCLEKSLNDSSFSPLQQQRQLEQQQLVETSENQYQRESIDNQLTSQTIKSLRKHYKAGLLSSSLANSNVSFNQTVPINDNVNQRKTSFNSTSTATTTSPPPFSTSTEPFPIHNETKRNSSGPILVTPRSSLSLKSPNDSVSTPSPGHYSGDKRYSLIHEIKALSLGNSLSGVFYCSSLITRKYSSETEPATGSVPVEAPICNHSSEPAALANRNSSSGLPEFNQGSSDSRKSVRIEGKYEVNLTSPSRPLLSGVTTTTEVTKSKNSNGGLSTSSGTGYLVSPSGPTIGSGLGSRGFQERKFCAYFKWYDWMSKRENCSLFLFPPDNKIRINCAIITEHRCFDYVILIFISLNCITLAMERPKIPPWSIERELLTAANYLFTVVFALEMALKVIANGLWYGDKAYFKSGWNVMDGILVGVSLFDLFLSFIAQKSPRIFGILRVFRLLRSLRPLRVINRAPGLKLVVQTLLSSLRPIGNIVLICCTFFLIFGILGVQLFKGALFYCEGPDVRFVKNKTDCLSDPRNRWVNRKYNFDNLGQALMALFVLSSKDGWVNIMYTGLDAVGVGQQPRENYNEWRLLYFISFLLLVAFFVLNMFVGVVVENFHRCREEQEKEERARRVEKRARKLEKRRRKMREPPYYIGYGPFRLKTHNMVTGKYFDAIIAGVICLNVITMSLEHYQMPWELEYSLKMFNFVFTSVFVCEALMKLYALGIRRYLKDKWDQLDVLIVILSIVGIILEEMESELIPINPTIIRVMRVARIARVLKLLKMAKGMRALLNTVMQALPQVGNLGLLFFLLFFIFAALGVELFGRLECDDDHPCQGLSEHAHFQNFGMAFLTLFRVATGDNWNGVMKDTLRDQCDSSRDCLRNCCVSPVIAPLYFVIFVLLAQFVLVNVVVAVLMKHLEESHKNMEEDDDYEIDMEIARELAAEKKALEDAIERKKRDDELRKCKSAFHRVASLPANFKFHFGIDQMIGSDEEEEGQDNEEQHNLIPNSSNREASCDNQNAYGADQLRGYNLIRMLDKNCDYTSQKGQDWRHPISEGPFIQIDTIEDDNDKDDRRRLLTRGEGNNTLYSELAGPGLTTPRKLSDVTIVDEESSLLTQCLLPSYPELALESDAVSVESITWTGEASESEKSLNSPPSGSENHQEQDLQQRRQQFPLQSHLPPAPTSSKPSIQHESSL